MASLRTTVKACRKQSRAFAKIHNELGADEVLAVSELFGKAADHLEELGDFCVSFSHILEQAETSNQEVTVSADAIGAPDWFVPFMDLTDSEELPSYTRKLARRAAGEMLFATERASSLLEQAILERETPGGNDEPTNGERD